MSNNRTPHWLIQLRFFLFCSPVGIVLAIVLAPWTVPVLISFGVTLFVFWHASRIFTNGFVKLFAPKEYDAIRQSSGDPFYDCLGSPLHNNSDMVRLAGVEPNANCPGCGEPVFLQDDTPLRCPVRDAHWHENRWWRWTGSKWITL